MRYDHLEENYDKTIRVGCWGCLLYVVLFFTAGGVLLALDLPIIQSVLVLAVFVLFWFISFVLARWLDQRKRK